MNKFNFFNKQFFLLLLIFCGIFTFSFAAEDNFDTSTAGVERYALYIGSNVGDSTTENLLYAGTDAISFQKAMADIGGVSSSNSILLLDPSKEDIDDAMESISTSINRSKRTTKRSEFIFYYSGHSDEESLLLGKTPYNYSELKEAISNVPSDVHVVILDSCYSGNFIRTKGGQKKKSFLLDDSSVVKGHAYLSSSSSKEFSQESDDIKSSFFTNAIITGLRGAADTTGDKKVSLNELYSYAFNETLAKTETSKVGPQHPNYNITLVGSGDLILSDISSSDTMLMITKETIGNVIIRNSTGKLISEINKTSLTPIYLALEAGTYTATIIAADETKQGTFELFANRVYELDSKSLGSVNQIAYKTRGRVSDVEDSLDTVAANENSESEEVTEYENLEDLTKSILTAVGFSAAIFLPHFHFLAKNDDLVDTAALTCLSLGIIGACENKILGSQFSGVYNYSSELFGIQASGIYNKSESVAGSQMAGCFNFANDVGGAQFSGIFNTAKKVTGFQISGVANIANDINGLQSSGVFNTASNVDGGQVSGVFNKAHDVNGAQVAGVFNVANDVDGVQVSGVFNNADKINGLQIGVVNINNDCEGLMIGLVNISRNGIREIGMSYSYLDEARVSFQTGTKNFYSVFSYSANPDYFFTPWEIAKNENAHFTTGIGVGYRKKAWLFDGYLDFEISYNNFSTKDTIVYIDRNLWKNIPFDDDEFNDIIDSSIYQKDNYEYPSIKCSYGFNLFNHLALFASLGVDFEIDGWNEGAFKDRKVPSSLDFDEWALYPTWEFGVKLRIR